MQDGAETRGELARRSQLPRRRRSVAAAAAAACSHSRSPRPLLLDRRLPLQPGYDVVLIGYRGAALVEELQGPVASGRLTLAYLPDL